MLIEKVYDDFVKHTRLTDSVYKSVFVKISEVLEKIRLIKWESLAYTVESPDGGENSVFNFNEIQEVPVYVVELFRNVFENFYEIPNNVTVSLKLQYAGVSYEIVAQGLTTTLPDEIKFIKDYRLYDLFLVNERVVDVFNEFDKTFSFIEQFKTDSKQIFAPILKRFENTSAAVQMAEDGLNEQAVTSTRLIIENLTTRRNDILKKLREMDTKKNELIEQKNKLTTNVNSYDYLIAEKEKLTVEAETLSASKKDYEGKVGEADHILKAIELGISDMNALPDDHPQKATELNFYLKKKTMFERERTSIQASIKDIDGLLTDISNRLRDIIQQVEMVEEYSSADIEVLKNKIATLEAESDDSYAVLMGIGNELHHQQQLLDNEALAIAQGGTESDATIQNIENANIVDHLATPEQPASITTVAKYLRYYFAYYTNSIADKLLTERVTIDGSIAQAMGAKIVLCRMFGVYFEQIFSAAHFIDNRIAKLIRITKNA